ncbi:GntR family transcriptional regulator [Arcobacter roscoffensis]|uniref:GntR family transcriptional regulator n=1 Tax=Arcobacter roscoffensis TaxID=2961520 RepID=A0ABY5E6T8_9BACT|nr:GntR family transcriptional regulator [Arcobacter roscoffensis]UTJ07455.1 GntR family transcriptional regulator [Arcobacter roscoffensis]
MLEINEHRTLEEEIVYFIFDSILNKKIQAGIKLSESVLAKEFNTSRDVIRKAFSQLQSMGILKYKKNQGFHVVWLTKEDTKDIFATRKILELGIIQILTQMHAKNELDLSLLNQSVETEEFLKVSLRNGEYVKSSCDFHLNLALLTKNDYLINALKPLIALSTLAALIYDNQETSFCSYDEHKVVIKAIESHDIENAKSIMYQHLNHCVESLDFDIKPSKKINLIFGK